MNQEVDLRRNNDSSTLLPDSVVAQLVSVSAFSHNLDPKEKLALPKEVEHWSLTTLREKLIKIGAKTIRHGRYITFQLAEIAIPRSLFTNTLRLIDGLRPAPLPP